LCGGREEEGEEQQQQHNIAKRIRNASHMALRIEFGSRGSSEGQFECPISVDVDERTKEIVVCDYGNCRVQRFDQTGRFVSSFGTIGSTPGLFKYPQGLCIDPERRRILVCDSYNQRVQIFDDEGSLLFAFGSKGDQDSSFNCPTSLSLDKQLGHIVVCDWSNHRVQIFDSAGQHVRSVGSQGSSAGQFHGPISVGILYDHTDKTEDDHLTSEACSSSALRSSDLGNRKGRYFVCDRLNHRVQIFDREWHFVGSFGSQGTLDGEFDGPNAIIIDHQRGMLFVSDFGNHRVQIFDLDGHFLFSLGDPSQLNHPHGLALHPDLGLIVCDWGNNRVFNFPLPDRS